MKYILQLVFAFIFLLNSAAAQPFQGHDFIGIGSKAWRIQQTIESIPTNTMVGVFADETFGPNVLSNVRALLSSGKVSAIRAQMHWSYQHKIVPIQKLKKLLPKWEELAKQFPQVKFYVSHSCEYDEKSIAEIQKRVDLVRQLAPSTIVVQTPMHSPVVDGFLVEVHTDKTDKNIGKGVSTDGNSLYDANATGWNKANQLAIYRLAWGMRYNLAEAHNETPANQRTAAPSIQYIKSLQVILADRGTPPQPTFVGEVVPFAKPRLYKSHAEDLQGSQPRDNKPLIIIGRRTDSVTVVTFNGKTVGKFIYFGGYPPNLHRFYSGLPGGLNLYGYEIAEKATILSGQPWVWFKQGNKYFGPVHPAYRDGYFQN